MADPGHSTAFSLLQITSNLLVTKPVLDCVVTIKVLEELTNEVGEAFLKVHHELEPLVRDNACILPSSGIVRQRDAIGGITPERFLGWLRKPPTLSDGRSVAPGSSNLAGSDALIETTHLKVSPAEVKKAIEQHKPWLNVGEIKKGISEALEEIPTTGEFSRSQRSKIESLFRKASPWDTVASCSSCPMSTGPATLVLKSRSRSGLTAASLWPTRAGPLTFSLDNDILRLLLLPGPLPLPQPLNIPLELG